MIVESTPGSILSETFLELQTGVLLVLITYTFQSILKALYLVSAKKI